MTHVPPDAPAGPPGAAQRPPADDGDQHRGRVPRDRRRAAGPVGLAVPLRARARWPWPPAWWRPPGGCTPRGRTGGCPSRSWPAWPRGRRPCSAARWRFPTLTERVYAAITIYAAGIWLSAATAVGPFLPPLPQALAIGAVMLSVPWWAHRRRRAKVRLDRKLQAWPDIAKAIGLAGAEVMSATVDVWGWRARFRLARGQTISDVVAKIPEIESGLGTFRGAVRVYPTPDDLAHRCEIRVLDVDPHAGAIPWPGPSVTSITQPVDLGPFEDASPCRVLFARLHGIFGGTTGSGKSGGLNVLMGNLVACRDVVIWAIDLKKGMELGPWQSCIDRLATSSRGSNYPAPRRGRRTGSTRGVARRCGQAHLGDIPELGPRSSSSLMNTPSWPTKRRTR